ncbi:patatin-like phospholipase family protein [Aquicoccus sp. SCR17]|nr:patatin-like phospholipase family protein [Carideicomes alvinocaridis]
MSEPPAPDQIVFSGGGLRCFWQGGFLEAVRERYDLAPARVTGVSGGALSGAAFLAGRERALLDEMCDAFASQDRNIDLFDRSSGISPHQEIYSDVVRRVLDEAATKRVAAGPQFQILVAHPPEPLPKLTGSAMTLAYESELHLKGSPHFDWAEKAGLEAELIDANAAAAEGVLAELVCAAAVIPPVFEPRLWNGRPVVDGGMADQAPLPEPDEGFTWMLLTREYKQLPDHPGRLHVYPSEETPADKIDFTDPGKLRDTWEQGYQDGRDWIRGWQGREKT